MANGFGGGRGMGRGFGRGMGFGFRGSSPPWPYVGIGRGGLPRCGYFLGSAPGASALPFPQVGYPVNSGFGPGQSPYPPYAASPALGNAPSSSEATPEQELDFLKNQAEAIGEQLEQIETRIRNLGSENKN